MFRRHKLSSEARHIVVSRLGSAVDRLHQQARNYEDSPARIEKRPDLSVALREAGDYLSEIRKGLQR